MIKILIVEDEELAALRLKKMLIEMDDQIQITGILESVKDAISWIRNNPLPDLIFLDIQLSDGISFEIFNTVPVDCPVIFVTAYDNYALRAFELNSIDYLLKPLRKELLANSLEKFRKRMGDFSSSSMMQKIYNMMEHYNIGNNAYKTRFALYKGDTILSVQTDNIAYFYIEDKVVILLQKDGDKTIINYSLDQLEKQLNPKQFFRINRQFIVSLASVVKASNYFNYKIMVQLNPPAPIDVIVSSSKTTDFKEWMDGV